MKFRTGVAQLDRICLGGGVPAGLLEISGEESSGKTAFLASIVRENPGPSVWISVSGLPEVRWLNACGAGDCVSVVPFSGEAVFEAAYRALVNGARVVVIDSLSQIDPSASATHVDSEHGGRGRWRLVSHGIRRLKITAASRGALVVFSNELRSTLYGRMEPTFHKVTRPHVRASLRLYRIKMRSVYGEFGYLSVGARVDRSVLLPPGGEAGFILTKVSGVNRALALLTAMVASGMFERRGTMWAFGGVTLGPGYSAACVDIEKDYEFWRTEYERGHR